MPSTPQEPTTLAARARLLTREKRRGEAYASLTALHRQTANGHDAGDQAFLEDDAGDPDPPPPLTLFALSAAGCLGCGNHVAEGQRYCRACDPRTA